MSRIDRKIRRERIRAEKRGTTMSAAWAKDQRLNRGKYSAKEWRDVQADLKAKRIVASVFGDNGSPLATAGTSGGDE